MDSLIIEIYPKSKIVYAKYIIYQPNTHVMLIDKEMICTYNMYMLMITRHLKYSGYIINDLALPKSSMFVMLRVPN